MKKLLFLSFALLALVSCSEKTETPEPPKMTTISFEPAEGMVSPMGKIVLADAIVEGFAPSVTPNVFWPKPMALYFGEKDADGQIVYHGNYIRTADDIAAFGAFYNDGTKWESGVMDTWGGIALSQNGNVAAAASDMANQFYVWADKGANGTQTFAVCFDSNTAGEGYGPVEDYGTPEVTFSNEVAVNKVSLANSTYTYPFFKGKDGDKFAVKIIGTIAGQEVGSIECVLIDGANKLSGWKTVDISSLGMVDGLLFKVVSSDSQAPFYFCMDELVIAIPM